jgi:hypothetical protein
MMDRLKQRSVDLTEALRRYLLAHVVGDLRAPEGTAP